MFTFLLVVKAGMSTSVLWCGYGVIAVFFKAFSAGTLVINAQGTNRQWLLILIIGSGGTNTQMSRLVEKSNARKIYIW